MSEIKDEAYAKALQEIEKLRLKHSELMDELLSYTGLPGQMQKIDVKIKQLKSLLIRAADALEDGPPETHLQLVQELRKAAHYIYFRLAT
jgi:hypothetical protein